MMFKDIKSFHQAQIDPRAKQETTPSAQKGSFPRYGVELEEKILKFWRENKIFEKSVERPNKLKANKAKIFTFYDGPPFANGLPHYGHILASIIKDVIPRYQTMKGKRVPRRWGWDCHGLPVEYELEKELKLETKKEIEKFGVEKFNEAAKSNVLRYVDDWKKIIPRIGRWVDMENAYKTMDPEYMESVWWVFKTLYDKKLIYEGYKSMHICPRCETTLANFEVAQGYQDIKDVSLIAKFELIDEPNAFVLAWTTTAWTLPGNVALAVNPKFDYSLVKIKDGKERFILAKERLGILGKEYKTIKEFKGNKLVGKKYKPLFDYYVKDKRLENRQNAWKIYGAGFVSMEEGTGVVHIAPAFGEDDMNLAQKHKLPFVQHVSLDGKFKSEVKHFAGLSVKPKENYQLTDRKIVSWLDAHNLLFSQEEIIHSYPHCWRCETPLLNYAASSWFVKVTALKNQLIKNNKKIHWVPAHIKEGRFGKWLEEARDWAISRGRFWGAPLPVWQCEGCKKIKIVGSIKDIKNNIKKSGNCYFTMRHGEAESNVKAILSSSLKTSRQHHLTKKGKDEIIKAAKKLKTERIDIIFSSDFVRCRETAKILAENLGLEKRKIIFDKRLREVNVGIFDGQSVEKYHSFASLTDKFIKKPPQGENLTELKNRVSAFLYETEAKYRNKNILIISHEYPIWLLFAAAVGADAEKAIALKGKSKNFLKTGEVKNLDFIPLPHNKNFELDLHRPYIDKIEFLCDCGGKMKRIPDVFDCWFESGSMPYGQAHYPFENKEKFEKNFPAEFIAEGLDQTRGWFYTLLALSTALFGKPAFKNVIVNGIILAEDGQKMSKRLKNYPDPMELVQKYGVDALRLYLLSSPVVRAEDINFSEKGVEEIYKKVILRLWNVYSFYELYTDKKAKNQKLKAKWSNVLDQWIIARLNQLIIEITKAMEKYELDKASKPISDFVDDLSTWYIRRSRDRFKNKGEDRRNAILTTGFVLEEFSKLLAPFMPFMAEEIYKTLNKELRIKNYESVHLADWPKMDRKLIDKKLLDMMREVRKICSLALEARQKAEIKVRQPLAALKIKNQKSKIKNNEELIDLIKDELNVKEIIFDAKISGEIELDTKITPELKAEGDLREVTRLIQGLRKEAGLLPTDRIRAYFQAPEEIEHIISKYLQDFQEKIGAKSIEFKRTEKLDAEKETQIEGQKIWLGIKRFK